MRKIFTVFMISIFTLPVFAQQNIFIRVDKINGESTDAYHRNWIDAYAYTGGVEQIGGIRAGSNGTVPSVNFQDYAFTLCMDKSINPMKLALVKGTHIASVTIDLTKDNGAGGKPFVYSRIVLENVEIISIAEGATVADNKTTVNVSFRAVRYKTYYHWIDPQTGVAGSVIVFGWDLDKNAEW